MSLQLQHICLLALCNNHKHCCCSNMPTGWVLLQDGCLLDRCHSISMPADLLPLNLACLLLLRFSICHTCWYGVSLSAMPAGVVPHYRTFLLVQCLTISHACWWCASLKVMPSGVMPHYQPCLLVWCLASLKVMPSVVVPHCRPCLLVWYLIIGHAWWCGTSLSAVSVGLVPQYRPCLLAWYLNIGHACWSVATLQQIFYWSSADGRRMVTSLVLPVQRCHYIRYDCWLGATLTYACLYSATLSDMHVGFIYSDTCICSASPSGKVFGLLKIHPTCLQVRCLFPWSATILDAILNISNSEWYMNSNHWDVTRNSKNSKIKFCVQIPGVYWSQGRFFYIFCKKLPFCRPYCLHSYFIFIWLQAKYLQLDSNFIANNLRKQMGLRHFFHITQFFHL